MLYLGVTHLYFKNNLRINVMLFMQVKIEV